MSPENEAPYRVFVVVDPAYGERLHDLPQSEPAWIVDSEINHPVIVALWQERDEDYPDGITSFEYDVNAGPEDWLISMIPMIDRHHDEYSHDPACSVLHVIGTAWSSAIQEELDAFGFFEREDTPEGFVARRNLAQWHPPEDADPRPA